MICNPYNMVATKKYTAQLIDEGAHGACEEVGARKETVEDTEKEQKGAIAGKLMTQINGRQRMPLFGKVLTARGDAIPGEGSHAHFNTHDFSPTSCSIDTRSPFLARARFDVGGHHRRVFARVADGSERRRLSATTSAVRLLVRLGPTKTTTIAEGFCSCWSGSPSGSGKVCQRSAPGWRGDRQGSLWRIETTTVGATTSTVRL